jgi:hypothetical protein
MAYLHKGDYIATMEFSAYPCQQDEVYVAGLNEGDLLISSKPEFLQNGNGYVAIDDRYVELQWIRDGALAKEFHLIWKNDCGIIMQEAQNVKVLPENQPQALELSAIAVIAFGCFVIMATKRIFYAKK